MFVLLLTGILLSPHASESAVRITCYDCLIPFNEYDLPPDCNEATNCTGYWCFKGPNFQANGIQHSCIDYPPLDNPGAQCVDVSSSDGRQTWQNCYCNNIEFCNHAYRVLDASLAAVFLCAVSAIASYWQTLC